MAFVELQRCFVRLEKDQEATLEVSRIWGRKYAGWIEWPELRDHRRVVLLAEASSGKSAEFRNQAETLRAAGSHAFFVTIEELADHGFEAALEPASALAFEQWRGGSGEAWFFLDSLDEARLNRKSFEGALKRFARVLGSSLDRARVFISCRVSDWKGAEDRGFIERLLPAWERPRDAEAEADPLLDPLFKEEQRPKSSVWQKPERKVNDLAVVQLVPLSLDQCRILASHRGIQDSEAFIKAIEQNGLEAFAERPGDVIDLAEYWKDFGKFDSFAQMVEHGVQHKLKQAIVAWAIFGEGNSVVPADAAQRAAYQGFIEVLKKVLPDNLGFTDLAVRPPDVLLVTRSGEFLIDAASGGITTLIEIAALIYGCSIRTDVKGKRFVVVYDEPENHLHPQLQRTLFQNLTDAFPTVQFIAATHSPFIVSSLKDSNVYVLRYQNVDEQTPTEQSRVVSQQLDYANRAGTASEILREVLGLPSTLPQWVENDLHRIIEKYQTETIDNVKLGQLKTELRDAGLAELFPEALSQLARGK